MNKFTTGYVTDKKFGNFIDFKKIQTWNMLLMQKHSIRG